jgi:hypothetical protein
MVWYVWKKSTPARGTIRRGLARGLSVTGGQPGDNSRDLSDLRPRRLGAIREVDGPARPATDPWSRVSRNLTYRLGCFLARSIAATRDREVSLSANRAVRTPPGWSRRKPAAANQTPRRHRAPSRDTSVRWERSHGVIARPGTDAQPISRPLGEWFNRDVPTQ